MAGVLYGFLGLAVYTLLRDLKQQGALLAARQPPPITLVRLVDSTPTSQRFIKSEVILGRDATCDYTLEDHTVSAKHARLSYHHQQWWVEDLASTNGTFLNDDIVTTSVVVTHGDELRMGHLGVKVEIG